MPLDTSVLSPEILELQKGLQERVLGQDRAIRQIIKAYVPTTVGMNRPDRPLGVFLFLGPTGVGKSELVKALAHVKLHNRNGITKIDCNEFQEGHEVMKLMGAPPSYIGYGDVPRLAQEKIDQYQTKKEKINIVLFDEIEKAHPRLFDAILSILGDGMLTLGNGKTTDFQNTYIFMTSNLGSAETRKTIEGSGLGFGGSEQAKDELDDQLYRTSKEAIKRKFRPEFINRIDSTIVFRPLSDETLYQILDNELRMLQRRVWESPFKNYKVGDAGPIPERRAISFQVTDAAKAFLLKEGTSKIYGARELNRTIDRFMTFPIACLISSGQASHGDRLKVDYAPGATDLSFEKHGTILIQ